MPAPVPPSETIPVWTATDVVLVRQRVRAWAVDAGFTLVDHTKLVTAASELARNLLTYGGGGEVRVERLGHGERLGLRVTFDDHGPGIADVEQALRDGFSTGKGLGLGLGGARRLVNEFSIRSAPGEGTTVTITRWK